MLPAATEIEIQAAAITYNQDGTANVTVTSAAGVPTGVVTLTVDDGPPIAQSLVNGSAVFIINAPEASSHGLHAEYAAQGNYAASSSSTTLNVSQAPTSVSISRPGGDLQSGRHRHTDRHREARACPRPPAR